MIADKKELNKVILTGTEPGNYFGETICLKEMKDWIINLWDNWKKEGTGQETDG